MNNIEIILMNFVIFFTGVLAGKFLHNASLQVEVTIPSVVLAFIVCGLIASVGICAKQNMVKDDTDNQEGKNNE